MKFILPRVIYGNRGDLASRWGLLRTLHALGVEDVTAFTRLLDDVPSDLPYHYLPYGRGRNMVLDREAWRSFRHSDTVLWAVGLDLQDDSSLAKLAYLWTQFRLYKRMGLRIWCLFQGAGPLSTRVGRSLARGVLRCVDVFVARDPGTQHLIRSLSSRTKVHLAHDAIFLPGVASDIQPGTLPPSQFVKKLIVGSSGPVIGFNIRQWFHFSSSILPYQLAHRSFQKRSESQMAVLTKSAQSIISELLQFDHARILLISAYQPGQVPWEDDLPRLKEIKAGFENHTNIILVDEALSMPDYFHMMAGLDVMIGMRLHSSLVALRFGVPAINISYTLKGKHIYQHLGIAENAIDLQHMMQSPGQLVETARRMLANLPAERARVQEQVSLAVTHNHDVLSDLLIYDSNN